MLVGKKLGPFTVDKELGAGAMGAVYRALHEKTGQAVAVKIIATALASNDSARARFEREVSILKQLEHKNITKYHGSGRWRNSPFYIMEFIEGESLDRILERRERLPWQEVVQIGTQLCAALTHAHAKGIIHRDLKPSNLMMLEDGTVKLTDFGIAKDTDVTALTAANSTLGTAAYMSPEQCRGLRDLTAKSDLYSTGILFYELLTGKKPFNAETVMDMFMLHTTGTCDRPSQWSLDIPVWFDKLIADLMAKKPEDRPRDADAVAEALEEISQKMQAMTSAGVEAAKRKRMDRSSLDIDLDETDRAAARTLLGKKRKVKAQPFYRKTWFTIAAVGAIAAFLALVAYWAFIKAPGADGLYQQADVLMKSDKMEDHKTARQGAIAQFLQYHPNDPRYAQVAQWRDQVDVEVLDYQTKNRYRGGLPADGDAEKTVFAGFDDETAGKLADAGQRWQELAKLKSDPKQEQRTWGLLALRYQAELKAVDELGVKLTTKVLQEKTFEKKIEGEGKEEIMALEAMREEQGENFAKAKTLWGDLKDHAERQPELRRRYSLAAKRARELKSNAP